MKVVVFGATGGVGNLVVQRALDKGHQVRAFVRDPTRLTVEHRGLDVYRGDVLNQASVEGAVDGQEGALVAVGSRLKADPVSVFSAGIKNIVEAMKKSPECKRLVCLSIMGVGESIERTGVSRYILPRVMGDALADRAIGEEIARGSDLAWVIVRASRLSDGPGKGTPKAGEDVKVGLRASSPRPVVAEFMVQQLTDDTYLHKAPTIVG